tara:strand:+ start:2403 stop:2783 length:381 start_codon:yes stop_codon:yes gene_type:complete
MALSTGTVAGSYIGTDIIEDTSSNHTPEDADASGGTLYQVYIDNTGNSGLVYVKLYEAAKGSVTISTSGSTSPSFIFPCPASTTKQFDFPTGIAYVTALSFATVTSPGTDGNTPPSSDVLVRLTIG